MGLRIVKFRNYGLSVETMPDDKGIVDMNMYVSVYELDNGKKICLESIKYYNKEKKEFEWGEFADGDKYHTCYVDHFNFGDDFNNWFHNMPMWTPETKFPSENEHNAVVKYYENNIKKDKYEESLSIY